MGKIYRQAMHHALMPVLEIENMQKMQKKASNSWLEEVTLGGSRV
jgi:uncharacterized membrane protein